MESLGNELKTARAKKNVSLERISEEIRINPRYLRGLEEAKYEDLPGGMYNRAFLRAYCEYLGLDSKEMVRRYEAETAQVSEKAPKAKKAFRPSSHPQPHPLMIWSFVLLGTIVGLYFSRGWITAVFSPYFSRPAPQPVVTAPKPEPVQAAAPQAIPKPPESVPPSDATTTTATPASTDVGGTLPPKENAPVPKTEPEPAATAQPVPAEPVTRPVQDQPQKTIQISFHVVQECWLSVSSDGKRVFVSVVKPGEDRVFGADERFNIILGNAGGVHLTINGKPAKPLGKSGEVLKIEINTSNLPEWLEKTTG
jgi:cytoskeleton protein RodZ